MKTIAILALALASGQSLTAAPKKDPGDSKATPTPPPQVEQKVLPVPGIDIIVRKGGNPGGHRTISGRDGSYTFTGLESGTYELRIEGREPKTVTVGKDGKITGVVLSEEKPGQQPTAKHIKDWDGKQRTQTEPKGSTDAGKVKGVSPD